MTTHRTKLWLGIGSFLLAGTSTAALALGAGGVNSNVGIEALSGAAPDGVQIAAGLEGGEGGERGRAKAGGEAGERGLPDGDVNVRFLTLLAMMEAHMDVGKRLFDLGHHDMAMPHFHHPYLEIYDRIEKDLQARGIRSFEPTLRHLGAAGDAKDARKIGKEFAEAKQDIANARATVHADMRHSPRVQMQVAIALLQAAAHEYDEAIADGKIHNVEEFQDGWAFVYEAEKAVGSVAATLKKSWPDAYGRMAEQLAALKRAWPDVVPPKQPAATTQEVHSTVSRLELAASQVTQ